MLSGVQRTLRAEPANEAQNESDNYPNRKDFVKPKNEHVDERGRDFWKKTMDALDVSGVQQNPASYASLLQLLGNAKSSSLLKRLHHHIIKDGHENTAYLGNLLVHIYGKCGALVDAESCFLQLDQRDASSWNIMIGVYGQHGQDELAVQLFEQMQHEGVFADKISFIKMLSVCSSQADLSKGRQMHIYIAQREFERDIVVGTALISMYGKSGSLLEAAMMFDKMPERNVISWNVMITAYAQHNHSNEALQLFEQMQREQIEPSKVTFTSQIGRAHV